MAFYGRYIGMSGGGSGTGVTSLDGMTGALTLVAGTGISITDGVGTITIASTSAGDVTLTPFGSAPNANAATLTGQALTLQPASASFPGGVSITTQSFAGNKTFTGTISASNLSGTNTGDVTLGTANGLSLLGQVLSLGLSSTSTTGALSSTDWNTFNSKQAAGNYITALTGDVTATGPGSVASTIAQIQGNPVTGTTGTGNVAFSASPTFTGTLSAAAVSLSGVLNMNSHLINSVTDPVAAQDAATKAYVDASVAALQPQTACFAASTVNIPGTYLNGVAGVGATFTTTSTTTPFAIDGVNPAVGQRILIKDQSSGFQNGIYRFTVAPVAGVSGAVFTRSTDYNTAQDMNDAGLIPVTHGTVNALSSWQQIAVITTVGTDALVFMEFTANPSLYLLKANNLNDVASASASFNNISPVTSVGDLILGTGVSTNSRLPIGSTGNVLTVAGGTAIWAPPATSGTVTSVSVVSANGFAGTVATATSTPAITLSTTVTGILKGNGTTISAQSVTNLTDVGTDGITITNGTGAVLGASPVTIAQQVADTTHNGYLSSTDWTTFNGKQAAGNYITALTGDVTASGPGSVAATLATVNANVGTFASVTVNGKGLVTAATALSGDATTSGAALTLATVNANVGSFGSSTAIPSFTVNAKGLVTAASTNVVIASAGTLTGTTLAANVVSSSLTSLGTITTGVWNGTAVDVAHGGTGNTTFTAYSIICAGTTATGIFQNVVGVGTTNQILTSNGAGALPSWKLNTPTYNATSKTANYTAVIGDFVICTSGTFTVTLPDASSQAGRSIKVLNKGAGVITLGTTASQTIDGLAGGAVFLGAAFDELTVTSDGSNWLIEVFGAVIVASYYCSANNAAGTANTINFDTKLADTWSIVTASAAGAGNWKFTAPIAGFYEINGGLILTTNTHVNASLYKNNSLFTGFIGTVESTDGEGDFTYIVQAAPGDFFDVRPTSNVTVAGGSLTAGNPSFINVKRLK